MIKPSKGCISILRKLLSQERIGGRHIPENLCLRWVKDLSKKEHRRALKDWERCKNEGLVLTKPKPSDLHVSINPRRLPEIYEWVGK